MVRFAPRALARSSFNTRRFSSATTDSPIPVIDLGGFLNGSEADKAAVVSELAEACQSIGFFTISNHGVPQDVIDEAWGETRKFFDLDAEIKLGMNIGMDDGYPYGYIPFSGETLSAGKQQEIGGEEKLAPPDLNESFAVGPYNPAAGAPPIKWPTEPAGFSDAWLNYYKEMEVLSANLLRCFALALDLPENWFEDKIDKHRCALRTLNYPDVVGDTLPGQLRASAHTDYGSLTILLQDDAPGGLQVMADDGRSGEWRSVPRVPGTFVVNLGDLMARWTNQRWVSTLHRVVLPPRDAKGSCRRQSMAFFHNINPDHMVQCIESCATPETPPKYPPIKAFDFLMEKHLASTGEKK